MSTVDAAALAAHRQAIEAACLEGLIDTPHGYKYRPSKGADAVIAALAPLLPQAQPDPRWWQRVQCWCPNRADGRQHDFLPGRGVGLCGEQATTQAQPDDEAVRAVTIDLDDEGQLRAIGAALVAQDRGYDDDSWMDLRAALSSPASAEVPCVCGAEMTRPYPNDTGYHSTTECIPEADRLTQGDTP